MTTDKSYNGWTNYETWCVNLWLDNNESDSHALQDIAEMDCSTYEKAQALKGWIEDANPLTDASMFTDLLNGALSMVNWMEIIENHLDDNE